ncbi:MAG: amidohydrolase family protein [Gemmatimonadota bacterium]
MRIIDVHNHYYPPAYLEAVERGPSTVRFTRDGEGNPVLHYPGDYNVVVPGHSDLGYRERVLEEQGVDVQVVTFTAPGAHVEDPSRAVELCRLVNDDLAAASRRPSGRIAALATLPLNDPAASADELSRAMTELGLPGAMVFANVQGVALADDRFLPLWERADELGAVIHIHPTQAPGVEAMTEYWLLPLVGFLMDTTLAAAGLVFAGVPERFPRIRWVLGHLGGTIPYLVERLDRGWRAFPECRERIDRPPSEYLRSFFYDGVNFDPKALRLAVDFAGASQILAGSDYPHRIGSIPLMKEVVEGAGLSGDERAAILGGNAESVYGL